MSAAVTKRRNPSIDWMRAISILYITGFWHLMGYTDYGPEHNVSPFFQITVVVLALFVFVSGYLLGGRSVPLTFAGLAGFYKKRLLRIYPPYLLAIVIFAVMGIADVTRLIKAAGLISMVYGPAPWTLWFITMIMAFYFITPPLTNLRNRPIILLAVCAGGWLIFAAGWSMTLRFDVRPLLYWPPFVLGIALAGREVRLSFVLGGLLAGVCAAAAWLSASATGADDNSIWSAPLAWTAAPLLFFIFNRRLPYSRVIHAVAAGSFFLYLFHRPILEVADTIVGRDEGPMSLALLLGSWLVAIPASIYGQKIYDRTLAALPQTIKSKPSRI